MIPNRINNKIMSRSNSSSAVRKTRSFSLDPDLLSQIESTKGNVSASERVNQLLEYALQMERKASLHKEAAEFFAGAPQDRDERQAFQRASLQSWKRK
jgi:hypothetical protein